MKITVRLIVSLIIAIAAVAFGFTYYQVSVEEQQLQTELSRRAVLLGDGLHESVVSLVQSDAREKLKRIVERFGNRERLLGLAVTDLQGILSFRLRISAQPSESRSRIGHCGRRKAADRGIPGTGRQANLHLCPAAPGGRQLFGALVLIPRCLVYRGKAGRHLENEPHSLRSALAYCCGDYARHGPVVHHRSGCTDGSVAPRDEKWKDAGNAAARFFAG